MRTQNWLVAAAIGAALSLSASNSPAQDDNGGGGGGRRRGNFDPAQFEQRMEDRAKEGLEITDDAEWKAIQPLIQKVFAARRAVGGRGFGFFGGPRGGPPGGGPEGQAGGGGRMRRGGPESTPEMEALRKAIDAKASPAELKAALAKFVEGRKVKEEQLKAAQEDLRKVLTSRQEAIATLYGLL